MITWLSVLYALVTSGDIWSTDWNREQIRLRGGDPNNAEKAPFMRMVMNVQGDQWWKVRALGGLALWTWLVVTRCWPFIDVDDQTIGSVLAILDAAIAGVVYYNSRKRFGLPWFA